ncbi:MAG: histidine phosphatase family protein [Xanthomonadales bacterium]|nr:histidine phosphatase family protein [Xanthomonadales bacterium]
MSQLILMRHGQAGQDPQDYDQLSALGEIQSGRLADHWISHDQQFDFVCCGTLVRHRRTFQALAARYAERSRSLPDAVEWPDLNEYRFDALLQGLKAVDPDAPTLVALEQMPSDRRRWIPALRTALLAWSAGRLDEVVPEPFDHFRQRIERVSQQLIAAAQEASRLLVVSSGGVISAFVQTALGAPPAAAVDLNLALMNSAVSQLRLDSSGVWRVQSFNSMSHLSGAEDRGLCTLV